MKMMMNTLSMGQAGGLAETLADEEGKEILDTISTYTNPKTLFGPIDRFFDRWVPAWHIPHSVIEHLLEEKDCDATECVNFRAKCQEAFDSPAQLSAEELQELGGRTLTTGQIYTGRLL